jgi:peptidyl-prolyl cis-trans isomerase B (cyclophilin B)
MKTFTLIIALFSSLQLFAQVKKLPLKKALVTVTTPKNTERLVQITTDYGVMVARLYDATPKHRDNFINLVQTGFYDSLLFHRIIKQFMIQGGDPTSKNADSLAMLGGGSASGNRIPSEFNSNCFHKKGALAAARDNNPEKASSNCQFYIVQGRRYDTAQLKGFSATTYTNAQKEIYQRIGGTPQLDQNYTVFGEIISGLDVIDQIATAATNATDRPLKNILMHIKLLN